MSILATYFLLDIYLLVIRSVVYVNVTTKGSKRLELDSLVCCCFIEGTRRFRMALDKNEHRHAQRTVRASVSSNGTRFRADSEMVVRNPAPDSSPPAVATGTSHNFTLSYALRV
jgi:hypothetical protein